MKLLYSPASPFARKVRVLVHEKGSADKVSYVPTTTMDNPAELLSANPLGRIPTLIMPNGRNVIESDVICAFLDDLLPGRKLIPAESAAHWDCLYRQGLGDGVMESAVRLIQEKNRPENERSLLWMSRWKDAIIRSVVTLEAGVKESAQEPDLGDIAIACAFGYIDFRHKEIDWRSHAPRLAAWYAAISARASFMESNPA